MNELNRFSEHFRIDQYLRNRSTQNVKSKSLKRHENILSNFPVGLIIITKEDLKFEDKIEFINQYACKLFRVKENINIRELKEKFNQFIKLKSNHSKTNKTLKDIIFNYSSFNFELDNFVPFECSYAKSIILYIKINEINNEKYIVIDKYDKYIEERKHLELNLIKTINYQYLHTLYHELNNPLNALLAISGDKERQNLFSTDITNSMIEKKPFIVQKKSLIKKKKSNSSVVNNMNNNLRNISNNKSGINIEVFENRLRKRNTIEDIYLNNKIPLLVNMIKIFIKNFILYLKIKTDSVLNNKSENTTQNESSDLMNAVELSEYEKELTKHQKVKINLEYIFGLYLEKFHCLFNYKEIDYETNFDRLKDIYVITDEFNFIYYIRQIYTFLYYIVPKKDGFIFDYEEGREVNTIKIIIKKKNNGNISKRTSEPLEYNNNKENKSSKEDMNQVIQTKEMTKEVLYALSKKLCFLLEIYDFDTEENNINNYLSIVMPIQIKDKSEEDDEFKDIDINEMIEKDSFLLEDKLKRQFPTCEVYERKKSNNSFIDLNSNNGKDNDDSSIGNQNKETNYNITSNNNIKNIKNNINDTSKDIRKKSEKKLSNLNINVRKESQKKVILLNNNDKNDNFLNKCLKIRENKKFERDKNNKGKYNPNLLKRKSHNLFKLNNNKTNIKMLLSQKHIMYNSISQKNNIKMKNAKFSGVFTKINNFGLSEELDCNDLSISNITGNTKNNKKEENIIKNKNENPNITSNVVQNNDNNRRTSNFNLEMNEKTQNSTNDKSPTNGIKNSKIKSSYIITDVIEGDNKNINININNNNIINIINDNDIQKNNIINNLNIENQEKKIQDIISNTKIIIPNKDKFIKLPEVNKPKRLSHNISPKIDPKDCMTFFNEEKKEIISKDKNTFVNEIISQNKSLLLDTNKEGEIKIQNTEGKNNSQIEGEEEEEDDEENMENEENEENEEKEDKQCDCLDILVVDDEEFNVMASQKMIKNLGYESDKAYNGEECINLIKEKQKLNCQCNKNYYKIIFLDIVMPVLDGIKAAKKIQEMIDNKEINENTQIVFVSGNIDGNDLKNSLLQIKCVKECLQKPVKIDKYQKIIEKYYIK